MAHSFDLDRLGWLQFEQLCEWALRVSPGENEIDWAGSADVLRIGTAERDIDTGDLGVGTLRAPATLGIAWAVGDTHRRHGLLSAAARRLWRKRGSGVDDGGAVLFTNGEVPATWGMGKKWPGLTVVDRGRLRTAINSSAALRLRMPSVVGLRPWPELVASASEGSTFDREAVRPLVPVFVPTRPYQRAVSVLERHRFVVLTGPPEMGKTAIANRIGVAQLADGWDVHPCLGPDDLWRRFDAVRPQVVVADDAFGSTEYRPDAAERWARDLPRILRATDDRHWLIWTSRPAPLRAGLHRVHQERGSERFPSPGEVQVDAADLDIDEKALILLRHAQAATLNTYMRMHVRERGVQVVDHPHFTPERIRRLARRLDRGADPRLEADRVTRILADL